MFAIRWLSSVTYKSHVIAQNNVPEKVQNPAKIVHECQLMFFCMGWGVCGGGGRGGQWGWGYLVVTAGPCPRRCGCPVAVRRHRRRRMGFWPQTARTRWLPPPTDLSGGSQGSGTGRDWPTQSGEGEGHAAHLPLHTSQHKQAGTGADTIWGGNRDTPLTSHHTPANTNRPGLGPTQSGEGEGHAAYLPPHTSQHKQAGTGRHNLGRERDTPLTSHHTPANTNRPGLGLTQSGEGEGHAAYLPPHTSQHKQAGTGADTIWGGRGTRRLPPTTHQPTQTGRDWGRHNLGRERDTPLTSHHTPANTNRPALGLTQSGEGEGHATYLPPHTSQHKQAGTGADTIWGGRGTRHLPPTTHQPTQTGRDWGRHNLGRERDTPLTSHHTPANTHRPALGLTQSGEGEGHATYLPPHTSQHKQAGTGRHNLGRERDTPLTSHHTPANTNRPGLGLTQSGEGEGHAAYLPPHTSQHKQTGTG